MEDLMAILAIPILTFTVIGVLSYNKVRQKWGRIIGVFGSYVILIGLMLFVSIISSLITLISGSENPANTGVGDIILMVIIMIACLVYMVVCMRKCSTVKEKILLPFAACMIGLGFCWRLLGSIVLHIPMSDGSQDAADEYDIRNLPNIIYDEAQNRWQLQHRNGDHVVYHNDAGQTVTIYYAQISRSGAITSAGNFHWY